MHRAPKLTMRGLIMSHRIFTFAQDVGRREEFVNHWRRASDFRILRILRSLRNCPVVAESRTAHCSFVDLKWNQLKKEINKNQQPKTFLTSFHGQRSKSKRARSENRLLILRTTIFHFSARLKNCAKRR